MNEDIEITYVSELRCNDLIDYEGSEYRAVKIEKMPFSWAASPAIYGIRFLVHLEPTNIRLKQYKPVNNSVEEFNKLWSSRQLYMDAIKAATKVIDQPGTYLVKRIKF